MAARRRSFAMIAIVLVYMTGLAVVAFATEPGRVANTGRVPVPTIPMGQGDSCVEDTDFMRRNHMSLLEHQRDETVHEGIRSKQHSLKECISCHVVNGADAVPVTVASPDHFCRSCHDYAAVKIDCFQCHAARPEPGTMPADHQLSGIFPDDPAVHGIE
jgi:predicted CXXCH cytochrome family protein